MGHCAAQDAFTKRLDDIIVDILMYSLLERCVNDGVMLRPVKLNRHVHKVLT